MDNTTTIALLVGAALILMIAFSSRGRGRSPPQGVPYIIEDDTTSTRFLSPSGGPSVEFVPVEDDRFLYSEYS